jgi:uncharacterized glyoxalase superfamily protein PhnB
MISRIGTVTVLADDALSLVKFYCETLDFGIKYAYDDYIELENEGVRFAVCSRAMMESETRHSSYREPKQGQGFTLAFPLTTYDQVDETYADLMARGAMPVQAPKTMPWGQRAAFFADPEGNIHQLFADLPRPAENDW